MRDRPWWRIFVPSCSADHPSSLIIGIGYDRFSLVIGDCLADRKEMECSWHETEDAARAHSERINARIHCESCGGSLDILAPTVGQCVSCGYQQRVPS